MVDKTSPIAPEAHLLPRRMSLRLKPLAEILS